MSATALVLIALSVGLHVGWNAASRDARPTASFFWLSLLTSSLVLTPVLLWHAALVPGALVAVWPALLLTSAFSTAYNVSLAAAYRTGELSLVYPLARSLGPVFVALCSLALGRGDDISATCLLGVATIVMGSALLPIDRWNELELSRYRTSAFLYALAIAASTAGYTLTDDQALRWLRTSATDALEPGEAALLYGALHAWATTLGLGAWVAFVPHERLSLRDVAGRQGRRAAAVGVASYVSYLLILAAMGFVSDVTYVAGFRQMGVPLAMVVGATALRERVGGPRLAGVLTCTVGLLLVALG